MEQLCEESYVENVIWICSMILVASFTIFGLWTWRLRQKADERWREVALLTVFSLAAAVMLPLIHKCAYQMSFIFRLGIVTLIIAAWAVYKYYTVGRR